jgi:polysaccharide biosynthesis transport protein
MAIPQNQITVTRRPPDIEDYIDMVRRYRSWIIGPMYVGLVVATVVAHLWPDNYISSATMRVTPQQVPDKLMPAVMHTQMSERLQAMQTEILSRNSLAEIVQAPSLDLFKKERTKLPIEDIVQEMKNKHIRISNIIDISASGRKGSSAFQISFAYPDKYKAQQVVRALVAKFTELNVTMQKNQASNTSNFLEDAKKQAKEKLDALEAQFVKFKVENEGRLPEQANAINARMSALNMQVMNLHSLLGTVSSDKMMLETQLKNQKAREKQEQGRLEQTVTVAGAPNTAVRNENLMNLDKQIAAARSHLDSAKQVFGGKHPEITQAETVLASLEQQRVKALQQQEAPAAPSAPVIRTVVNPEAMKALEELKSDVANTETAITAKQLKMDELNRNIEMVNRQLAGFQKQISEAPQSEQQYYALQRELDLAKNEYTEMSKRRELAEASQTLEEHKAGENLEVLDPPFLPDRPFEPNRPLWTAAGAFGGLILGFLLAAGKEVKDSSLKNLKDVRAYTNLPVLSSVPLLENALLVRRKRRLVWLGWTSAIVMGSIIMGASVYYRYTTV